MPLLNYTTSIEPEKTIAELRKCLVAHGAKGIMEEYADGQVSAISFVVPTQFGDRSFLLPARIEAVHKTLHEQYHKRKVERRYTTREQAARVGWRILKDWVEAQMAVIESGMTSLEEVFLPYMVEASGRTLFEFMREQRLALPSPKENGR